jgi:para-aminobenzoate synthetase/4-amino-4-deoxychorismate lyase
MFRDFPERLASSIDGETNSVLLRTACYDSKNFRSYHFQGCRETLIADSLEDVPNVFAGMEAALQEGLYVAGFLSYECGAHFEPRALPADFGFASPKNLPLAWFGVYESPAIFDHSGPSLDSRLTPHYSSSFAANDKADVELEISPSDYAQQVERIKHYIEAGDAYQVNFTTAVSFPYRGSPSSLLASLLKNQPVAYGALLNLGDAQIVSASPELFFRLENGTIATRPMKGTARRGKDIVEDATQADWLAHDEKNRSENVMIVDLLRNDLGRICAPGSIAVENLFAIERYRTLLQMTSTITGKVRPELSLYEIFRALFPCGSIVGAPKVRTMQIISELERRPRGIYTGAIGFIAPEREAVFSVAIRTLVLRDGIAEMGVGSGIVYESDAEDEYEECRLKAAFLLHAPPEFQLIETMLWDGEYFLLDQHLERLAASAEYFDFEFDRDRVLARLGELPHTFLSGARYRVRLLMDRAGEVHLTSSVLEESRLPLVVRLGFESVSSEDVFLRHKTTHRALYDRVYREALADGFDDALFLNERGEVAEGAIHNIFIEKSGRLSTPPLSAGVLPGVFRRHLLKTCIDASERMLGLDDLRSADRVFLCNSVRGLREVGSIHSGNEVLFSRVATETIPLG